MTNVLNKSPWSSGQDASLSRWNQGFDSPWRYQKKNSVSCGRVFLMQIFRRESNPGGRERRKNVSPLRSAGCAVRIFSVFCL